jgi:hypothetical protein
MIFKTQEKPSALKREYPGLQKMKFSNSFLFFEGHLCPSVSSSTTLQKGNKKRSKYLFIPGTYFSHRGKGVHHTCHEIKHLGLGSGDIGTSGGLIRCCIAIESSPSPEILNNTLRRCKH